jgi:hypothetical protein
MTTWPTKDSEWNPPVNLGPAINSPYYDGQPTISQDGLSLYFESNRPGGYGGLDLYVVTRATQQDAWGPPANVGAPVNTANSDGGAAISADDRVLFFARIQSEDTDLWVTTRRAQDQNWEPPIHLGANINTSGYMAHDWCPEISPDGTLLYFSTRKSGGIGYYDLWQAPIFPIVDFNADGKVNLVDLVMLINDWGTDKTLCDIGPMPWGDGEVDIEDLKVFMTYYEKENPPISETASGEHFGLP